MGAGAMSAVVVVMLAACGPVWGLSIVNSKHDMSFNSTSGGPKTSDSSQTEICIFCHAPHKAGRNVPLWNQNITQATTYTFYSSTYLTGMGFTGANAPAAGDEDGTNTELCLSCHDGVNAPGEVYSLSPTTIPMSKGMAVNTLVGAVASSGLQDDHPILYPLDNAIDPTLRGTPTPPVTVSTANKVECTSCHDPHDNANGYFLKETATGGALCMACHKLQDNTNDFASSVHATSAAAAPAGLPFPGPATIADNGCLNCHRMHGVSVGTNVHLLRGLEEGTCYACHNGGLAGADNVGGVVSGSTYKHDVVTSVAVHLNTEKYSFDETDFEGGNRHVECEDCHNPHYVQRITVPKSAATGDNFSPALLGAWGVVPTYTTAWPNPPTTYLPTTFITDFPKDGDDIEAYLCLKCHSGYGNSAILADVSGDFNDSGPVAARHPVFGAGTNPYCSPTATNGGVVTMEPPWNQNADEHNPMMCTDCHGSSTEPPYGPHGSNLDPNAGSGGIMLRGSMIAVDYGGGDWGTPFCLICHKQSVYLGNSNGSAFGAHPGSQGNHAVAPGDTGGNGIGGCLACHGNYNFRDFHAENYQWVQAYDDKGKAKGTGPGPAQFFMNNLTNFGPAGTGGWEPGRCYLAWDGTGCNPGHDRSY